jgi:hypothetical protein
MSVAAFIDSSVPRVYLAGKIAIHDWRHLLVPGLNNASATESWLPADKFVYVGPFFIACRHGCYHGRNQHGAFLRGERACVEPDYFTQREIYLRNNSALDQAALVFTYIEQPDCYGTLTEIGRASLSASRIVICFAPGIDTSEFWYATESAHATYRDVEKHQLKTILNLEVAKTPVWRGGN